MALNAHEKILRQIGKIEKEIHKEETVIARANKKIVQRQEKIELLKAEAKKAAEDQLALAGKTEAQKRQTENMADQQQQAAV